MLNFAELLDGEVGVVIHPVGLLLVQQFLIIGDVPAEKVGGLVAKHRGDGGYIIAPPSRVLRPGGVRALYRLIVTSGDAPAPVDAARLREFLDPHTPLPIDRARPTRVGRRGSDAKVLAGWVAGRGEGERNRGLFWAACRLAEAGTPPDATLEALGPAAEHAGLGAREIMATIRSAYRTTRPAPRTTAELAVGERRLVRESPGRVLS